MADPWMIGAILAQVLLPMLLGRGKQTQERVTETEIPPRGYQSPLVGLADPMAFESILRNLQSHSGWGWPAGSGRGQASPQIAELLKLLQGEWPKLMSGYKNLGATAGPGGGRRTSMRGIEGIGG